MLVAIDAGNTEIKIGCFTADAALGDTWRIATDPRRTPDEYAALLRQLFTAARADLSAVDGVAVASVVPALDATLETTCARLFGATPLFLKPHVQSVIAMRTAYPQESGADLVAAAIGGRQRYGAPLIVVSYGTATVFVAISAAGEYLGVAIAPGITISIDALIGRTAKLPQVALETPERAIGRTTVDALQAGIVYGFAGQTEAIVARMRAELGDAARVVATGGLAETFAKHVACVDAIDPALSLMGLQVFYASSRR
ncbi:MAG TPA: type III pantothenate kinase [Candidatus Tumulicola sp.]|nr:type III pantothenate kinase [Candidatus Tumulicola sp.]